MKQVVLFLLAMLFAAILPSCSIDEQIEPQVVYDQESCDNYDITYMADIDRWSVEIYSNKPSVEVVREMRFRDGTDVPQVQRFTVDKRSYGCWRIAKTDGIIFRLTIDGCTSGWY